MLGKTLPRLPRKQPGDDSARGSTPYRKWAEGIAETRMEQACRPAAHLIRSSRSSQPNQTAQRRAAALSPDDRNESDWRTIARRAFRPSFEKTGLAPSWIDFQPPSGAGIFTLARKCNDNSAPRAQFIVDEYATSPQPSFPPSLRQTHAKLLSERPWS
jgi:hypothetical protein